MSDNYILNVLALLRELRTAPTDPARTHINRWCGRESTEAQAARICAYVLDQAAAAESIISASSLSDEAKEGLLQTTRGISGAFNLSNLHTSLQAHLPALNSAIANFAILASANRLLASDKPQEVADLIAAVDQMAKRFDEAGLDPVVHETAIRHLRVLATMLQQVDVFGVDAAMVAYSEMVLRLRRATAAAGNAKTTEKVKELWPEIERWAGRLAIIDQAMNAGQHVLGHIGDAMALLPHIVG